MAPADIPAPVRRLLLDAIDSVPELEALLLLRDTEGQRWTPDTIGARLYVSRTVATHTLDVLFRRGFLHETPEGFTYRPSSPALAETVTELARTYATSLIAVTQLIHAKPSPSVQDFARAFRIRSEDR
jgi:hypothetical protein